MSKELKLKCIDTFWFLDVGGKLKRMNMLDNAQNVCLRDNVIFAGDKHYQVFINGDSDISVSEIENLCLAASTASSRTTSVQIKSIVIDDKSSIENALNNAGRSDDRDSVSDIADVRTSTNIVQEKKANSSSSDSLTTSNRSDDGKKFGSAENALNNAASPKQLQSSFDDGNLYASVTKDNIERGSSSDSEADYDLKKSHEEYIAKKGIFRGIFERIKKAVKRKPSKQQQKTLYKKEESIYERITIDEKEIASPNISSEIYEDVLHIRTNINEVQGPTLVTALYDFEAFLDDEISFKKSDRFKLYEEAKSSNREWCLAEHLKTGKKGYIPRAFVTKDMSSVETKEWWFNVERYAAEQLLISGSFCPGTFLVRPSNGMPMEANTCVLSVLCEDLSKGFRVAHYQIRQHLGRVYISPRITFIDISELVDFCKAKEAGLTCKLRRPVPKHSPIIYPRQMEVKRKCLGQLVPFEYGNYLKLRSGKFFDIQDVTVARISTGKMTLEEFREATTLLYNLRDPKAKIVRMIAVTFDPVSYLIVLGETIYCTLKEYLKKKGRKTHDLSVLIQYAAQVADGMAFLEKNNIVHGYLRASCAFVCYPYVVKIAHPKLNELISGETRNIKRQGDWKWTAPEAINDERNYSVKSDVWSYGVLLYELITLGEEPYNGLTAEEALSLLEKGVRPQKPYESPDRCPIAFYFTMLKCWHKHPECRPTFDFLRELFLDFQNIEPFEIGLKADADEITLNKDDVITDVDPNFDANWWKGTTPGDKRGMFPSSYVEVPEGSQGDSQPTHIESTERHITLEQTTNKAEDKQGCKFSCVKALYSYEAADDDEIPLNEDDVITDVDPNYDANWWIGTTPGGKRGIFPSNYVEVLEGSQGDSQPTHIESTERNVTLEQATNKAEDKQGCRGFCVKALYSYEAADDDEIPLNEDDVITDVDPNYDANWWIGTTPGGKRGMFPSSYVEVPEGSQGDSQPTHIESTERNVTLEQTTNKAEDKQGCRFSCVKALYSYDADDGDEISLNKDDVKTDVDPNEVDPYNEGTTPDGKRGMIPSNNGEVLEDVLTVRALYDFDAINDDYLSFRKGDKLEVDEEASQNSGWWVAKHLKTGAKGYIPSNYVTKDDNSPQSQDWWYNVDKKEADKQLLLPGNPTGTFLMREAGDKASFVLSVRDFDPKMNDACVKHYRIRRLDNGGFYISPKRTFENMLDLIFHYRNAADGMCCKLEIPCPKVRPLVQFRELEVSRESVKLLKKLGSGCFREVYAGKWRNTVDVAVKTLKQGKMTADDFLAEAKLMHHLRHNKLVQLMAVCTNSEPIWIITELMINGALLDYLRKDEGKSLQFKDLADMAGQIADGMAYLEMENFVHRDLRAANILVGDHNEVKVADFGLARLIQEDIYEAHENTKFPIKWTAPEAAFDRKFSIKSDVWSFGVLLYELITFGRVPYPGMNGHEVLNRVEKGFRMPKPTGGPVPCPEPYYEIMLKCWNRVADSRPTFAYLEYFFNNYMVSAEGEYRPIDD